MRIENNDIAGASGVRTPAADAQQRVKTPQPAETQRAPAEDSVETSAIASQAATDPAKIERLREAVRSGTYVVDARKVAASIVREHLDNDK